MALEAQFAPLRALATPPAQTAASPVSERGRVSRTHSTENLMTTVRSVHLVKTQSVEFVPKVLPCSIVN